MATPPVAEKAPEPARYTVVKGDSLSKIAKKHYGNGNLWKKIYSANRGVIGENPDLIKPGQVLVEIAFSGACGSQVNEAMGLKGEDRWLPHCLGHEATGTVLEVGPSVTKVKAGDKVVLSWLKGSGIEAGGAGRAAEALRQPPRQRRELRRHGLAVGPGSHPPHEVVAEAPRLQALGADPVHDPEQRTVVRELELRRHHGNDGAGVSRDLVGAPHDGGVGAEPGHPGIAAVGEDPGIDPGNPEPAGHLVQMEPSPPVVDAADEEVDPKLA